MSLHSGSTEARTGSECKAWIIKKHIDIACESLSDFKQDDLGKI